MNKRASMKRLMTLALSVIMVAGIMPFTALAETGALPVGASADTGDEVIALAPLNTESGGLRALADTTDLITGDGYTFDPATGKLTVTSDDGTTAWRNDTEIAAEDTDRYAAIKSLEIGDDVTAIGYSAFNGCGNLTALDLSAYKGNTIGNFAFSYCIRLQGTLTIPASVTYIGAYAFEHCRITELDLSNFTGAIGGGAFYCCSDITGTVTIAAGVSAIGNDAFYACDGITALDISGYTGNIGIEAFKDCSSLTGTLTISAGRINKNAFENCSNITALDISARTTNIGAEAFKNCSKLNSVTFRRDTPPTMGVLASAPPGTDGVGTAFSGVAAEGTIYCPTSAYREYATLSDIAILIGWTVVGVDALDLISGDGYTFDPATGKLTVTSNDGTTAWRSDSGIAEDDTERYEAIKSLEIGDGVTDIGESAFEDCDALDSVKFNSGTPPAISDSAFYSDAETPLVGTVYCPTGTSEPYQTALASTRLKDWTYSLPIPLTFTDDAAFDVPTGTISSDIDGIFVADGVSGGTPPYTFSLVSGPDWLVVYDNGFILGKRPDAKAEATTAVIRVTDSEEPAAYATITINIVAVTKLPQSAPPTPYWESTTMTSVKLGEIPNAWYRCGADGEWQSSPLFTGLTPDTSYTFYACYPETSTHEASPPSEGLTVTTMKVWLTGTVTIVGDAHFGATLTADTSGLRTNLEGTDMGDLTFEWHRKNGETITAVGTDSATYTLTQADIGATITLTVTAANCNGSVVSAATTTVTKAPYTGTTTVTDTVRAEQTTTGKTLTLPPLPDGATYAATGTAGGTTPTLINGTPSVSGTTLTYSTISQPDNTTATITIAVTGVTNYNDYNVVVTVTATALIPQTITFPNANAGITRTYGDATFTHVASGGTGSGAITYTSSNTAVATVNATSGLVTIKGAGTATITAIKAADGAYAEATASYALTVNKATVTITANDKTSTVGDTQPAYTYTVTGLAAGDILATLPTANCPTADMNTAGTYTIVASGAAVPSAMNYNEVIVYKNGTLTVNTKPPVTYTLTIRAGAGGSITQGTSGNCAQGTIINISANANSGYTFNGWTSSYGGAFGNAGSASTTFTMPGNATTITANFISTEVEPPDTTPTPTPTILTPYPVISHPSAWSVDSSGNATAKIDAPFEKFVRLLNNGVVINPSNYTVTDGSTIITFNAIYLETLSAGTHNIRAEFTDGYADLTLSIKETADIPDGDTPDVPKTGDNSNMLGWIIALLASGLGLLCLAVWRKWRQVKGKR